MHIKKGKRNAEEHFGLSGVEKKLCDMLPVLMQINEQHRFGRFGFDICIQNITPIGPGGALKLMPNALNNAAVRPGYSPPEQYFTGKRLGRWSDVYKASALIYFLIAGELPPAAFKREQNEPVFDTPLPERLLGIANEVEKGLALDIDERPNTLENLYKAIKSLEPCGFDKAPKFKTQLFAVALIAMASLSGSVFAVNEINYSRAVAFANECAFEKAERSLNGVLEFYRDAKKLRQYVNAGLLLEKQNFDEAEQQFKALGEYQNACEMVSETKYKRSLHILENKDYIRAKQNFDSLGNYRDCVFLAKEAAYLQAVEYKKAGNIIDSLALLNSIQPYKDSNEKIIRLHESVYKKALEYFRNYEYCSAYDYFKATAGYLQSDSYAAVCKILNLPFEAFNEDCFSQLVAYSDKIDLSDVLMNDDFIILFLQGCWEDGKNNSLKIAEDKSVITNMPYKNGIYFYFKDSALIIKTGDNKEHKAFVFKYINKNSINVYCCKNAKSYTLLRKY